MGVVELVRGYPGYRQELELEVFIHEAGPETFKEMLRELGIKVTELKGGETINLSGFDFLVVQTPGHTIDGISFYQPESKTLFSGDTVLPEAMAEPDEKAGGRFDHYFFALRNLRRLEIDHIMPGHGGIGPAGGPAGPP